MPSLTLLMSLPTVARAWSTLEEWFEGAEETLVVFPTYATIDDDGALEIPLRAWVFEREEDSKTRQIFVGLLRRTLEIDGDARLERFEERIWPFLVDNERGKRVEMRLGNETFELGTTAPNGHVRKRLRVPASVAAEAIHTAEEGRWIEPTFRAEFGEIDHAIPVVESTGLSVVSDVDDTIKITWVGDRRKMLEQTFLEEFEAVDGMAEWYRRLEKRHDPLFHYLSASPWQLLPFLEPFLAEAGFPDGLFHLRQLRPKSITSPTDFAAGSRDYKLAILERLVTDFPERRFVLIGDSSEHDPEVYGEIARAHPDAIAHIAIRRVDGADNAPARFEAAFDGLSPDRWQSFETPDDAFSAISP